MNKFFICGLFLLVTACSSQTKPLIENDYALQAQKLSVHGLDALHHGRMASAEKSLQHALRSAWLSTDLIHVARAEYHLGALYLAQSKYEQARGALSSAQGYAQYVGDRVTVWRTAFALALLSQQTGGKILATPDLQKGMPNDIYLSAARLAHLQLRFEDAKWAYEFVNKQSVEGVGSVYHHAQAALGLALVARDEQRKDSVTLMSEKVLAFSKQAGFPVLAAHALLLQGEVLNDSDKLERARSTYQVLADIQGQKDSLIQLLRLAQLAEDEQRMQRYREALRLLGVRR